MKHLIFLILLVFSRTAYAFPEMVSLGYQSCKSCHYAPSGSGQITKYGRAIAGSELSTWGTPKQAETFFGVFNVDPLDISASSHYLYHRYEDDQVRINQRFFMERSLSIAFNAADNVTFLASGGLYGPDPKNIEYRTYFGIVHLGPAWVRAGRFLPSFGYEIDDHTKAIKTFLGQGKESINIETGYSQKYFEATLTRVFGEQPSIDLSNRPTIKQKTDWDGYTGKLNFFLAKGAQLGVSQAMTDNGTTKSAITGYHGFFGFRKLYTLLEYQVHPNADNRAYGMFGIQPFKGFHIRAEVDSSKDKVETFGTLRWFPVPHVDMMFSASNLQQVFVFHFYL